MYIFFIRYIKNLKMIACEVLARELEFSKMSNFDKF